MERISYKLFNQDGLNLKISSWSHFQKVDWGKWWKAENRNIHNSASICENIAINISKYTSKQLTVWRRYNQFSSKS